LTGFENSLGSHPRKKRGFEKSKLVLKDFWDFKLSFVPTLNKSGADSSVQKFDDRRRIEFFCRPEVVLRAIDL
jgi:hypothetical protein